MLSGQWPLGRGDESSAIRYLAAGALRQRGGPEVVAVLRAFLATEPAPEARAEAEAVLAAIEEVGR